MNRSYFQETFYDMPVDIASNYAHALRDAILSGAHFDGEKKQGYYLSRSGGYKDELYVGRARMTDGTLYYGDQEVSDDDQIINVVVIDGPITRDGTECAYGSRDHRDQVMYANNIPQVVGHIFLINSPGGASSARIDYEQAIKDCREKGKPTVAWIDGMACSAAQLVAALCDRTIVMNGRHTMGCIGTMCAFWGVPNGNVNQNGERYIELVSVSTPDKNADYREAVDGKTEKLQAELNKLGDEFRETVRQYRPNVKEEHLTGMTFHADEVMGELVDEIGDFQRAIDVVLELSNSAGGIDADPSVAPSAQAKSMQSSSATATGVIGDSYIPQDGASNGDMECAPAGEDAADADAADGGEGAPAGEDAQDGASNGDMEGAPAGEDAADGDAAEGGEGAAAGEDAADGDAAEGGEGAAAGEDAADADAAEGGEGAAAEGGEGAAAGEDAPDGDAAEGGEGAAAGEDAPDGDAAEGGEGAAAGEDTPDGDAAEGGEGSAAGEDTPDGDAAEGGEGSAAGKDAALGNQTTAAAGQLQAGIEDQAIIITQLRNQLEALNAKISAQSASIDELEAVVAKQKQALAEKEHEIRELEGQPLPIQHAVTAASNGVGAPPSSRRPKSFSGMSYEQIYAELNKE